MSAERRAEHARTTVVVLTVVLAIAALLWSSGRTTVARAASPAAAIRTQTSYPCNPNAIACITTRPTTAPPTTRPAVTNPCAVVGATRICPTTVTTAGGGGVVVVVGNGDVGTPITPPPTVTTPPTPDEARIQVGGFDFGAVQVGASSPNGDVTVTNVGSIPVRYLGATVEGPFAVVGSNCGNGGVLNVKATCTVTLRYTPTAAGSQSGAVTVTVLAPVGNLTQPGPLVGAGTRSQIAIEPGSFDFGSVTLLDTIAPAPAVIRNTGSGPARITGLKFAATTKDFTIQAAGCLGATIGPGATCPFTVTAKPRTGGVRSALVVATGAAGEISRASVKATVLRTGLSIAPSPVDLGAALITTPAVSKQATIRNTGQVPVVIAAVALTGSQAAEFSIPANGCAGVTLKPKATCSVTIAGSPKLPGLRSATLTVTGGRKEAAKTSARMRGVTPTTTAATTTPPVTTAPPITVTTAVPVTTAVATVPPTTVPPTTAPPTTAPPTTATATTRAPAVFTPTLVMRPAVGRPGSVTSAIGTGFPPNAPVRLAWESDGVVRVVTADANGRFSLPVLVRAGERIGGRYMATVDPGASYAGLRAPFLVQLPTFRPPGDSSGSGSLVGRG